MSAVAEKPKAAAKRAARKPVPAVSEVQTLFAQAGDFLVKASGTDEDHTFSGESDRLLSIGAGIALDAAEGRLSNSTEENTAYDVAACINAARLVPDDSESVERTIYIDNAAQCFEAITGTAVHRMIFTDVPRPIRGSVLTPEPAPIARKSFKKSQRKELHRQAFAHLESAYSVLCHYSDYADDDASRALRDLVEVYLETAKTRLTSKKIGSLGTGALSDLSCDLCKIVALLSPLNGQANDGVMRAVEQLLSAAKRITDGDLGVLE